MVGDEPIASPILRTAHEVSRYWLVLAATNYFLRRLEPCAGASAQAEAAYQTTLRAQAALQAKRKTQEEIRTVKLKLDEVWRGLPTETEFALTGARHFLNWDAASE